MRDVLDAYATERKMVCLLKKLAVHESTAWTVGDKGHPYSERGVEPCLLPGPAPFAA